MKIGFIGCGNMATAIINGILNNKLVNCDSIYAYDVYEPALTEISSQLGINACKDENEVLMCSDIVFLAVKPNVLATVLNKISPSVDGQILISIAAGKTISFIQENLGKQTKIVRVMPNINAKVCEAISAICSNNNTSSEEIELIQSIISSFGKTLMLDESQFPLFGVLGGCSPAFVYMFIDELARAGVQNGMKKDEALKIAAQAVYGSAKMIMESDEHPYNLIDNVCSPGGTTIEGVTSLQNDGFPTAIHNAVNKAVEKDKKL